MSLPLEDVAALYLRAAERGEQPTRAVATRYGLKSSTARGWVWYCRQRGLLPPTEPGKSPRVKRRCPTCGAPPSRWGHEPGKGRR